MDRPTVIPLRVGAWCVDPRFGQISRQGEVFRVEARTMKLLLCLAGRAGEVVSVDDLLAEVWSSVVVTPDSVYQAVASLRRVLGDDAKQPEYIATVPRLGYRMVAAVSPWVEESRLEERRVKPPRDGGPRVEGPRVEEPGVGQPGVEESRSEGPGWSNRALKGHAARSRASRPALGGLAFGATARRRATRRGPPRRSAARRTTTPTSAPAPSRPPVGPHRSRARPLRGARRRLPTQQRTRSINSVRGRPAVPRPHYAGNE